ncbi:Uncharacterised protein [Bordetella pertussis]|nr:Uncharacterised protein [Bordetella pertussis]
MAVRPPADSTVPRHSASGRLRRRQTTSTTQAAEMTSASALASQEMEAS